MSDLLALLKRIEFIDMRDDCGLTYMNCPDCTDTMPDHYTDCELKAQIDRLEAEHASERNEGHA